jgi:hypothetical protein
VTFKHYGIGVKWVTEETPEAFAAAIDENTKAIYVESIANPKYLVSDIPAIAKVPNYFRFCDPGWLISDKNRSPMITAYHSLWTTLLEWEV